VTASTALPEGEAASQDETTGYVEFYGYHAGAGGWFFSGWVRGPPELGGPLKNFAAWFHDKSVIGEVSWLQFARDDVGDAGTGFLIFLKTDTIPEHPLSSIQIGAGQKIYPVLDVLGLPEKKLTPQLGYVIAKAEDSPEKSEMQRLLAGETVAAGLIEYFGYHKAAGGWFFSGWAARPGAARRGAASGLDRMAIAFENGDVRGQALQTDYPRDDLPDGAQGIILFLQAPPGPLGQLQSAHLYTSGLHIQLTPIRSVPQYRESQLATALKSSLADATPGLASERLLNLLSRRPYQGETTLHTLAPAINLHVDEAIRCGATGLAIIGWMLAKPGEIKEIRLHCGTLAQTVSPASFLKIDRPDVLAAMVKHGFEDSACGFAAYAAGPMDPDTPIYLEIETRRYQTAYYNIPDPLRTGMAAIKHLLSIVDARFANIAPAFDGVIGPAVAALNQARLALPAGHQVMDYGEAPQAPEFSIIIPLHGRLDFVEYQQALFSARPSAAAEFIYVLDDPPRRREAQALFASVYERFRLPFRAILLDQNLGFAPANNAGLRHAKGNFIAYLNSDVFPGALDWLERLSAHFAADPHLGAIGPKLIFEDGTIQHNGMYFEKLPEYGGWYFCQHHGKGLRHSGTELQYFPAITGACMVLRRETAHQFGGFDETYIIGDFEDSDLCLKLHALDLKCAIDPTVQLYHLERKSQLSGALTWRANLTAYNAWQHQRRWAATIESLQGRLS